MLQIQADLIQCGIKPVSIRLIRKKKTGNDRPILRISKLLQKKILMGLSNESP